MNKQTINEKLHTKMTAEYDRFIEHLKNLPPEQIIEKSYEKVFKEDILLSIEGDYLPPEKAKVLYKLNEPLASLYSAWLDVDDTFMDRLRDCIEGYADKMMVMQRREQSAER